MSCQSTQKVVEYPSLDWADVPAVTNPDGTSKAVLNASDMTVTIPFTLWKDITKYIIDTESNKEILENLAQ